MADEVLQTDRLVLRPPAAEDLPFILQEMNSPAVMRYLGGEIRPSAEVSAGLEADIAAFASGEWRRWTVWLRGEGRRAGRCGLFRVRTEAAPAALRGQPEIGWTLAEAFWGRGLATESARAALAYAFDRLDYPLVYSQTSDSNAHSTRMMHRLGFSARAELSYEDPDYPPRDNPTTVWSLAAEDFARDG